MAVELIHPFNVSRNGTISVTQNPDRQINQRVNALLSTQPGERRANYAFGIPTRDLLFENLGTAIATVITEQIKDKLNVYEPGVLVQRLDIADSSDAQGLAAVRLDYTRREAPLSPAGIARNTNTAIVNVGGTVNEIVRG